MGVRFDSRDGGGNEDGFCAVALPCGPHMKGPCFSRLSLSSPIPLAHSRRFRSGAQPPACSISSSVVLSISDLTAGGESTMEEGSEAQNHPADKLTDDMIVEILSLAPVKSICSSKCVSRRWHAIISHPDHRRKLPQDLAGFFYSVVGGDAHFITASGTGRPFIDPSLSFLPSMHGRLDVVDTCNGLLLCRRFLKSTEPETFEYVVVNPATEKWVVVPASPCSNSAQAVRLGFDPAVSSHFHVFEVEATVLQAAGDEEDGYAERVEIYSSQTGVWSHKHSGWNPSVFVICYGFGSVFFNGMLHMVSSGATVVAVDVEGKVWRTIDFPQYKDGSYPNEEPGFISVSHGKLYFANADYTTDSANFAIWVLEDYTSGEWTLKQTVSYSHLTGEEHDVLLSAVVHPERNLMFYCFGKDKTFASYDMDSGNVHVISDLGENCDADLMPYVPLFSESFADGKR